MAGACPAGEEQLVAETLACQAPGICWLFPWRGCKRSRSTCPLTPLEVVEEGQELLKRWRSSYSQRLGQPAGGGSGAAPAVQELLWRCRSSNWGRPAGGRS